LWFKEVALVSGPKFLVFEAFGSKDGSLETTVTIRIGTVTGFEDLCRIQTIPCPM